MPMSILTFLYIILISKLLFFVSHVFLFLDNLFVEICPVLQDLKP